MRRPRPRVVRWIDEHGTTIGMLLAVAVIVAGLLLGAAAHQGQQDANTASSNASRIADPVLNLCASRPDVPPALCTAASQVKTDPVTPVQAPLDEAQVLSLVDRELARRGQTLPGVAPRVTLDQLTQAVRQVIAQNPGLFDQRTGIAPSNESIAAVVSSYLRANPEMFRGRDGRNGSDGSDGRSGAQGIGVSSMDVRSDGNGCDLVVGLTDPATGATSVKSTPVNPLLCGSSSTGPSTDPTSGPTTGPSSEPTPSMTPLPTADPSPIPTEPAPTSEPSSPLGGLLGGN